MSLLLVKMSLLWVKMSLLWVRNADLWMKTAAGQALPVEQLEPGRTVGTKELE
jgi:hypothetical protein